MIRGECDVNSIRLQRGERGPARELYARVWRTRSRERVWRLARRPPPGGGAPPRAGLTRRWQRAETGLDLLLMCPSQASAKMLSRWQ